MQLHNLKRKTKNRASKQVGRGGRRGKTSGRGTKGQKARSGHRIRPEIRDEIKRLPKLRGRGVNSNKSIEISPVAINISRLDQIFEDGNTVNPLTLAKMKVVKRVSGEPRPVKILGTGETKKKFTIEGCTISASARNKIEKAGGKIL